MNQHQEDSTQSKVGEKILDEIRAGKVRMRPRLFFLLQAAGLVFAATVSLALAIFLASYVLFILRLNGLQMLPGFGLRGWRIFFAAFPWILVVLLFLFVAALEIFSERFRMVYRRPLVYSLLVILLIVLFGGYLVGRTEIHSYLLRQARVQRLPFVGPVYGSLNSQNSRGFILGRVAEVEENRMVLETGGGQLVEVSVSEEGSARLEGCCLPDDMVMAVVRRADGAAVAEAVRKIKVSKDAEFYRSHMDLMHFNEAGDR